MTWQYNLPSSKALETVTNTTFDVRFGRVISTVDDFEISPVPGSKTKFSAQELAELKVSFWEAHVQSQLRNSMSRIVENDFGGDRQWVAYTLSDATKRKVSNRTVQAWLMEPGKPSSRTCPEWAFQALKDFVENPVNKEELERGRARRAARSGSTRGSAIDVDSNFSVQFATSQILDDEKRLSEWQGAGFDSLPQMLFRLEKQTQGYLSFLQDQQVAFETALRTSTSFEEFKTTALDAIRDKEQAKQSVKDAKNAIQNKTREFASDDGIEE